MKLLLMILFIFSVSCSQEQASRIGYNLGRISVEGSLSKNDYIILSGRKYYKTPSCYDYGYADKNYEEINIFDCLLREELYYVAFYGTQDIIYYFIK